MPRFLPSMKGEVSKIIDIMTMASLLWEARNRFLTVIWESGQNKRLRKTGNPYKDDVITKLYVATMRNDFRFSNSVKNEVERLGGDIGDWKPQARTWGEHIPHTPFVVHQIKEGETGEPLRLHTKFLPALKPRTREKAYWEVEDETGYYVDGEKIDDAELKPFESKRKKPVEIIDIARQAKHPVNSRLDDIRYIKISGSWYRIKAPTMAEIESLAVCAVKFGQQAEPLVQAA